MGKTPRLQWKQALITLAVALVVAFILNWGILKLFGEKSPYRAQHGLVGIALLMGFVFIHPAKEENSAKAVGFFAFALIPSYLGTVFPDLDIRLCGIGCHRNPLFHSGLSFLILLCLVRHQGVFLQTLAIGYGLGQADIFSLTMASALNRFVFLISIPALIFGLLIRTPFDQFNGLALAGFAAIELVMYSAGYLIARLIFKRQTREALLIGLSTAFANHLLFVLPIAITLFGESATTPIIAIATVDALFIYGGTLLLMDALSESGASIPRLLKAFSKNPQIWATVGGLVIGLAGINLPDGIHVFTKFAGNTAAPCSLFALGVVLSQQANNDELALPLAIGGLKLIVYPLLVWALLFNFLAIEPAWSNPAMMVAAAPSSAMAFVLALNYQVPVKAIATTILITMIGSLATVTYFSGF